jgi:hypothetical protein
LNLSSEILFNRLFKSLLSPEVIVGREGEPPNKPGIKEVLTEKN